MFTAFLALITKIEYVYFHCLISHVRKIRPTELLFSRMNPTFLVTILGFIWAPSSGRGQEEDERSIVASIEAQAKTLPTESYNQDPYWFSQTIYPSTNATTYHWTTGQASGPALFHRNTSDEGKDIIVLKMGEDRLRVGRTKRTFVVLIRDQVTKNTKAFHPLFAYARGDTIEWDLWEPERLIESKAFVLGWSTCTSSIFTPCKSKIERNPNGSPPDYLEEFQKESVISIYNSKYDYFLDLEDTPEEIREVGRFVSSAVTGQMGGRMIASKTKQSDRPVSKGSPNFEDVYDDAKLQVSSGSNGMSGRGVAVPAHEQFKLIATKTVAAGNRTLAEAEAEELAKYANQTDYEFEITGEIITVTASPDPTTLAPTTNAENPTQTDQTTPHPGFLTTPNPKLKATNIPDSKSKTTPDPKLKTTPPASITTQDPKSKTTPDPILKTTPNHTVTTPDPKLKTTPHHTVTTPDPKLKTTPHNTTITPDPKLKTTPHQTVITPDPKLNATPHDSNHTITTPDPKLKTTPHHTVTTPDPKLKTTPHNSNHTITTPDPKLTTAPHNLSHTITTPDPKLKTPHNSGTTPDPKLKTPHNSGTMPDPKLKTTPNPTITTPDPKLKTTPHHTATTPNPILKPTPHNSVTTSHPNTKTTSDPAKSKTTPTLNPKSKTTTAGPKSQTAPKQANASLTAHETTTATIETSMTSTASEVTTASTTAVLRTTDSITQDPNLETTPGAESKSNATPASKSKATPDPKSRTTPNPNSKPTPDPHSNVTPDPKSKTTPDPKSKTTPNPNSKPTPDPHSNVTPDPKSKTTPDPNPNSKTTPDPHTNATPDPESKTTPDSHSMATPDPNSNTTPDPHSKATPDPKSKITPNPNSKTTPNPNSNTTPDPHSKAAPDPKSKITPNPNSKTTPDPHAKTTPDPEFTTTALADVTASSTPSRPGDPNSTTPDSKIQTTVGPKTKTTSNPKLKTTTNPKSKISPKPAINTKPDHSKTTPGTGDHVPLTTPSTNENSDATPESNSATTPAPNSKTTKNPNSKTTLVPKSQIPSKPTGNSKFEAPQTTNVASASAAEITTASPAALETTIGTSRDKTPNPKQNSQTPNPKLNTPNPNPNPNSNVTQKPTVTPTPEPKPTNASIPTTTHSNATTTTTSPEKKVTKKPKSKPESDDEEDEDEDESTEAPKPKKKKKKKKTTITVEITPQMAAQMHQSGGGNQGTYSGNNAYKPTNTGQGGVGSNKPGQTAGATNKNQKCQSGGGLLGLLGLNLGLGLNSNKGGLGLGLSLGVGCKNLLNLGVGLGGSQKSGAGLGLGLGLGPNGNYYAGQVGTGNQGLRNGNPQLQVTLKNKGRAISANKTSEIPLNAPKASIEGIRKFLNSKLSKVDLFGRPGWKTQDIGTDKLKSFKVQEERDPFTGFGECGHENVTLCRFKAGTDVAGLVKSRLTPLRAQCKNELVQVLINVVKNGGLLSNETFPKKANHTFFKLLLDWKIVTKPKLTMEEKAQLNIAFEFYWFSQMFLWTLDHPGQPFHTVKDMIKDTFPSPFEESPKSPYVVFRLYTALLMFDEIFVYLPEHAIALSRNLILTMKTTFIKSLQDYFRLKNCGACDPAEAAHLSNDLISLIAFPEFISSIFSSDAVARGPVALVTNFNKFVNDNSEYLQNKLLDYVS